ncbi:hypothetical protein [uncultured Treponema sp.]|nr:hypothetical protein [uncultured Treponema sp.]
MIFADPPYFLSNGGTQMRDVMNMTSYRIVKSFYTFLSDKYFEERE